MVGKLMNAEDLDAILAVLRARGVASAEVPLNAYTSLLRVVFAPDVPQPPPPGDEVTPGGWKNATRLDRDPLEDERSVP
jgi:anthranilate phosphoribosyltransferase